MKEYFAKKLINKTKTDYNRIAADFSNKRKYLPSDIVALEKYLKEGWKVLDLGCGNGRLAQLFPGSNGYVGVDTSEELIKKAKESYPKNHFLLLDGLDLPFSDNNFDVIFCLAVLHHIPGKAYRLKFLQEARRVLKPGGKIIITVWNMWAKPGTKQAIAKYALLNLGKFDWGDILFPFRDSNGRPVVLRYIHCFSVREFIGLIKKTGFNIIDSGVWRRGAKQVNENLFVVAEKV